MCEREKSLAMNIVSGAMGSLLPKLGELLKEEYKLQKGVKKDVESLAREMASMHAALHKVAEVPLDQLDEQVRLWANDVRDLSYHMEDVVDSFLVRVEESEPPASSDGFKGLLKKMATLFKKGKTCHEIADAIKNIKDQVHDVAARRERYKVDGVVASVAATLDPPLGFGVRKAKEDGNGDFCFGLGNLASIRRVYVGIDRDGATVGEVKEAVAKLQHAVDVHHNHPSISPDIRPPMELVREDEVQTSNEVTAPKNNEEQTWDPKKFQERFQNFRVKTASDSISEIQNLGNSNLESTNLVREIKNSEMKRDVHVLNRNVNAKSNEDDGPHNLVLTKAYSLSEDFEDDEAQRDLDDCTDPRIHREKEKKTRSKRNYSATSVRRSVRLKKQH